MSFMKYRKNAWNTSQFDMFRMQIASLTVCGGVMKFMPIFNVFYNLQ